MQRDHTDSQFRNLSENLETQEVRRLQVWYSILYYAIYCAILLYYTVPYHTIPYYTRLTLLYSTLLYYTLLYCTNTIRIPYEYYNNTTLLLYLLRDVQAKLEGARGALLRHEKVTAEQAGDGMPGFRVSAAVLGFGVSGFRLRAQLRSLSANILGGV